MGKIYTHFQTKKAQKPYPMGRTYLYGFYKGVPPPHPPDYFLTNKGHENFLLLCITSIYSRLEQVLPFLKSGFCK